VSSQWVCPSHRVRIPNVISGLIIDPSQKCNLRHVPT
jgi:hypothetical protein